MSSGAATASSADSDLCYATIPAGWLLRSVWHVKSTFPPAMMGLRLCDVQSAGCPLSSDMYCVASFSQMCQQHRIGMQSLYEHNS